MNCQQTTVLQKISHKNPAGTQMFSKGLYNV